MRRRTWLLGAATGAGLIAGGGTALWRSRSRRRMEVDDAPPPDLWKSTFPSPAGEPLVMSRFAGKPLLLNFWATWCAPCVTEMPLLDKFARSQPLAGFQVVALAVDDAAKVAVFLKAQALHMNIGVAGASGLDLSRSLGNSAGALPFSIAFAADGSLIGKKLGSLTESQLGDWASHVL